MTRLPIRWLLLLITCVVALPAAGIILYSGIQYRNAVLEDANKETVKLADRIGTEHQDLVAGAVQLMTAQNQLPDVKRGDAARVVPVLRELRKLNPMYSNIFIADTAGKVWATAVPVKPPFFVGDRRYFRNALADNRLSSGEFIISRATAKPSFNFACPLKDDQGGIIGVISVGFVIDRYRNLLEQMQFPKGTDIVLLDHRGVILSRSVNPEAVIGKPYPAAGFRDIGEGPEAGTAVRIGMTGDEQIVSYRKLRFAGEKTPYMYVLAGIPVAEAVRKANAALVKNVAIFTSFLMLSCLCAAVIGKRSVMDRVKLLEDASQRLAAGDLQVRVSELVVGGELGSLGKTFDAMAAELARREAERSKAEAEKDLLTGQLMQAHKMES
ncbi:MAG TPA: cache domain-containing protein, partial [Candidatus Deferrimicrobiaceae bacterium]